MNTLKGKVALITGSTSGIGLAVATSFAQNDAHVILNGFASEEEIKKVIDQLSSLGGGKIVFCPADLTKADDIENLIAFAEKTFGKLDILVNNAGMQHVATVENFPVEKWDMIIALNLTASFHTTRLALPIMRKNNFGRIINIASTHALVASAGKSAYVASKHGILGFTKVVALETAQENITCNAICPGFVLTPLVEAQIRAKMEVSGRSFDEESEVFVGDKHASKKFVPAVEVAEACLFLASDHASQIKGAQIVLDGGWTVQ